MDISARQQVFSINNEDDFTHVALQIFKYQAKHCEVYRAFLHSLKTDIDAITQIENVPFLPVEFFKNHVITDRQTPADVVFSSSGTTGMVTSSHHVVDIAWYTESFGKAFELFYGPIKNHTVLALLPSYLEREGSSLIFMVEALIKQSQNTDSGFFLYNHEELYQRLTLLKKTGSPTLLIGVTFALLDFVEIYKLDFPDLIVMETGGMKGRRKEMIREELHHQLCIGFGVRAVHSEYGMTELLSQAYSNGGGTFKCPPWMKVLTRDTNDPLTILSYGQTGGINVIDLANLHSCSFIATQDLGRVQPDGTFEILGRFDNSDIRGCNLLIA